MTIAAPQLFPQVNACVFPMSTGSFIRACLAFSRIGLEFASPSTVGS
jgi:hypothetical protein